MLIVELKFKGGSGKESVREGTRGQRGEGKITCSSGLC